MSVLQLRRDMVVVEEEPAVEIDKPFPLRKIDHAEVETPIEAEVAEVEEELEPLPRAQRGFFGTLRLGFNIAAALAVIGAYPAMTIAASDVGDQNVSSGVDRTRWTAPWAGGVAVLMEKHFADLGWASDAPEWSPMARLTAKPAYQAAMAGALGEFVDLSRTQLEANGIADADLDAAARLISETSTGTQLRAARDALVSYDHRLKRRASAVSTTPQQISEQLALVSQWGVRSQGELTGASGRTGASAVDTGAALAVYAAKGRAMAAYTVLDAMHWPDASHAATQRSAALAAWKAAAEFHPLVVLNGSPDGSLFGNHAASMAFLVIQAEKATEEFAAAVHANQPVAAPIIANAIAPGTFK